MSPEIVYERHSNSVLVAGLVLEDSHVEGDSYCNARALEELLGQLFVVDMVGDLGSQAEVDIEVEVVAEWRTSACWEYCWLAVAAAAVVADSHWVPD